MAHGELCWELNLLNSLVQKCLAESCWDTFVLTVQSQALKYSRVSPNSSVILGKLCLRSGVHVKRSREARQVLGLPNP